MGVPQALSTSHSRSGLQNPETEQNRETTFYYGKSKIFNFKNL